MLLGCIGDDFTGSSDLANTLARGGMRTVLYSGLPRGAADPGIEAGVVALKSRTIAAKDAIAASLAALKWLRAQGCTQFFFKYCSTFDSTAAGNIGPVAEALADALDARIVPVCPAFPSAGRTVYQGHLFVNDRLLSESGMENHPLTPMTDPDIRRMLQAQAAWPVRHLPHAVVARGAGAIGQALADQAQAGKALLVLDAIDDDALVAIGHAARELKLVTGGSGVALGLPDNFASAGKLRSDKPGWAGVQGPVAALAGSVSQTTRRQVSAHIAARQPSRALDPAAVIAGSVTPSGLVQWVIESQPRGVPLIYSSADPEAVRQAQARYGTEEVSGAIEALFARTAVMLAENGFGRLISAGGETSGAIVTALDIAALDIGPEIDPGVPALKVPDRALALALKSGNFGAEDFFLKAARMLAAPR